MRYELLWLFLTCVWRTDSRARFAGVLWSAVRPCRRALGSAPPGCASGARHFFDSDEPFCNTRQIVLSFQNNDRFTDTPSELGKSRSLEQGWCSTTSDLNLALFIEYFPLHMDVYWEIYNKLCIQNDFATRWHLSVVIIHSTQNFSNKTKKKLFSISKP